MIVTLIVMILLAVIGIVFRKPVVAAYEWLRKETEDLPWNK